MDWVLFTVVLIGWVIGYILLGRLCTWLVIRAGWTFHTMTEKNNPWLEMNESAQERFHWEDEDANRK